MTKRLPRLVTSTFTVVRDDADVRLDIAGDYYAGEEASTGPGDTHPGCGGEVNLLSVELNGAEFWGDLTGRERRQAEDELRAVGDRS